jgi:hypothetical protein
MPSTETLIEKRQRLAVEGVGAWKAYHAEQKHIDDNMHRLRAERLAREQVIVLPVVKRKSKKKA